MHISFVCDETTQYGDANLSICYNLAKELRARGHDICILGHCDHSTAPLEETVEGIPNYRFYYPANQINREIFGAFEKNHSLLRLGINLLRHPATAYVVLARVFAGYFPIENQYVRLIKRVHRQKNFDLVIACGGAFQPIHALAKCKINCKRIGYMLDPHWKHKINRWYYKREELFAWKNLDKIVIPKLLASDYTDHEFDPYREKMIAAEFPGIAAHSRMDTKISFDAGKTNLLFAGNFYEQIRSPSYLLSLVDAMPDSICLHILGGIYGTFKQEEAACMERLTAQGKLKLHGMIPTSQARSVMQQADILINIGNAIDNMLPSKIFEYFSTGKPVIHIKKIADCPCVSYMEKYWNALVISEQDPVSENVEKVMAFCQSDLNVLPFETISSRFRECTISYVADLFLELSK